MAGSVCEQQQISGGFVQALLLVNAFFVGSVLMGFEMLGSRYLFPYFGGGIGTWAGLISTVLLALTLGYFAGGAVVDRHPSPRVIATCCGIAAAYLAVVPASADPLMMGIMNDIGDGPSGILLAAACLLLVPLSFLGTFSPVAVRLLLRSTAETGRIAGMVYGVSTIGNIFGTLFTTFYLIPTIGSREITYVYAAVLALCALSMLIVPRPRA
ncbi:MAG TPA: fused MFS/spermidine synthase [Stellaceae bacterium]|nr:fused MFS/spermidine synthase [Stellaceae bacterium]